MGVTNGFHNYIGRFGDKRIITNTRRSLSSKVNLRLPQFFVLVEFRLRYEQGLGQAKEKSIRFIGA